MTDIGSAGFSGPSGNPSLVAPLKLPASSGKPLTTGGGITLDNGAGVMEVNSPTTSLAGTTAGTVVWSQPQRGSACKKFVANVTGYENTTTIAQTITFPTAFAQTPIVTTNTGMTLTASTTTLTLPASMTAIATDGVIVVEGV